MKRLQYAAFCLALAILGSTFAGAALAQRQPVGRFEWEARDGDLKVGGEYLFEPGGRYRMTVAGIKPPVTYVGRWEMRQDTVVVYAQDGGEQTYRWEGGDLVLVGNTTGLPAGRIVLRHRTAPSARSP
jgi:hypothetical protein